MAFDYAALRDRWYREGWFSARTCLDAFESGVPDSRYGEAVAVVVVLKPDVTLDIAEIRRHFDESGLAREKAPEFLVIDDSLPRTALGKVKKAELRARHFPQPGAGPKARSTQSS